MGRVLVLGVLIVVGLSGCTPAPRPSPTTSTTSMGTASSTPAPTVTVTTSPSPSPSAPAPAAKGCSNGGTAIPAGASTATIPDVDGDGRADTAFYAETSPFEYGIRTAAGGVYILKDDLAGPGTHSGWTAAVDMAVGHLTVLDDGRTATLHAFVGCRFVTTRNREGQPYRFGLNGFYTTGTGVACSSDNGGILLQGVLAVKRSDGRYDIRWTLVNVSADGALATNGTTITRWTGLAATDPRVRASMTSTCGSAPKVGTSGR